MRGRIGGRGMGEGSLCFVDSFTDSGTHTTN